MYRLTYRSQASSLLSRTQIGALLHQSRLKNFRAGLSGLLVVRGDQFLQFLEGAEDDVKSAFLQIESDPRHHHLVILEEGATARRAFPQWAMGCKLLPACANDITRLEDQAALAAELGPLFRGIRRDIFPAARQSGRMSPCY